MKRLLSTSLLATAAYGLTLLAGASAASADAPTGLANADRPVVFSAATAALADGDEIWARLLVQTSNNGTSVTDATAAPDRGS